MQTEKTDRKSNKIRKPAKVFYAQVALLLIAMYMTGSYLGDRFHLGIDDQFEPCLPYKYYVIDRHDKDLQRNQFLSFISDKRTAQWFAEGSQFVKKIKAVAGDRILVDLNGKLFINGNEEGRLEPVIMGKIQKKAGDLLRDEQVPAGKYFVMGQTDTSFDSRYWGYVDQDQVVGTVYPIR